MGVLQRLWMLRNAIVIILTPILLSPLLAKGTQEHAAGFCLILMAVYWATEAFPIAVTALLPVMLFPMVGLMPGKSVSKTYINDSSMLFVGGLIMAAAVEDWNIHKRIALKLLMVIGTQPTMLMFGMMLPSWFLSMWTSNMATTAMMCPIADALLKELQKGEERGTNETIEGSPALDNDQEEVQLAIKSDERLVSQDENTGTAVMEQETKRDRNKTSSQYVASKEHLQLAKAMTISIAYAANIGGTTTITGCASNIILKGQADDIFKERGLDGSGITFGSWLVFGFPVSLLIFIAVFFWLTLYFRGCGCLKNNTSGSHNVREYVKREYKALGPIKFPEILVMTLFAILIVLWVSRDLGGAGGWGNLFPKGYVTDSAAPTLVTALLFLVPANLPEIFSKRLHLCEEGHELPSLNWYQGGWCSELATLCVYRGVVTQIKPLLTWRVVHDKVPWGLFLLFGGGFALSEGCRVSGLSASIREALTVFSDLPVWLTSFLVALLASFVTEVVTNTATCTLVLPIIAQLALGIGINPLYLMIPTAVATSYAFMLPVATPPNAMVYVLGYFSITEMMRAGFICNLMSIIILTVGLNTWGAAFYDLHTLPFDIETTTEQVLINTTFSSLNLSSIALT